MCVYEGRRLQFNFWAGTRRIATTSPVRWYVFNACPHILRLLCPRQHYPAASTDSALQASYIVTNTDSNGSSDVPHLTDKPHGAPASSAEGAVQPDNQQPPSIELAKLELASSSIPSTTNCAPTQQGAVSGTAASDMAAPATLTKASPVLVPTPARGHTEPPPDLVFRRLVRREGYTPKTLDDSDDD